MVTWRHPRKASGRKHKRISSPQQLGLEPLEPRCLLTAGIGTYGQLPLAFEPNVGQAAAEVNYLARGPGYGLFLSPTEALLSLKPSGGTSAASHFVGLQLLGADPAAAARGQDPLPGVSNYLIGNDPSQWHTNVRTYGQVAYASVYPGIDLVYYGNQTQLEYDLVVHPGAVPGSIRFQLQGVSAISINAQGDLVLHTSSGDVVQQAPKIYQQADGLRQPVAGRYILQDGGTVGFAVGAYDHSRPLVIDPTIIYSTYLGGNSYDEATGIAIDGSRNAYISGLTASTNFPTANPFQGSFAGTPNPFVDDNAFIAKLNPAGTALVYSTYLGGSSGDTIADAIAVDGAGSAYVTGTTSASNFPTAGGPVQPLYAGGLHDGFVAKLSAAGNALVYSTYLGGSGDDVENSIALDPSGNAYVAGATFSSNFATASALQAALKSGQDATVSELNATGSALVYSTYLGGSDTDVAKGISVDAAGHAYVAGTTASSNFPTAGTPFQASHAADGGHFDAFVAKINIAGAGLAYATYLGGGVDDQALAVAADAGGNAILTGFTDSTNFPTANAFQPLYSGSSSDAFVTKLNTTGSALVYSTYLGGAGDEQGNAVAVDTQGNAYVAGVTSSSNFPTVGPGATTLHGSRDAFVTKFGTLGGLPAGSTLLGGSDLDEARAIAVDPSGNAYIAGMTFSTDFPTTAGALQGVHASDSNAEDAFITKMSLRLWNEKDVAVGADSKTRLAWDTFDGRADVWAVTGASSPASGPVFGPLAGWSVKAIASGGSDGLTRLLWSNTSGVYSLWLVNADGTLNSSIVFGVAGWQALDVAVDSASQTHLLWFNPSLGQMVVWTVSNSFAVTSGPAYGPFSGWSPVKLDAGADALLRVLWNNSNGAASVWTLGNNNQEQATGVYGPISGWTASDVTVGSDGLSRILWTNPTSNAAAIWILDSSLGVTAANVYGGPLLSGWQAQALSSGPDGLLRMEWNNADGTAAVWRLHNDGTFVDVGVFGPF